MGWWMLAEWVVVGWWRVYPTGLGVGRIVPEFKAVSIGQH